MRFSEIINEAREAGFIDPSYVEIEVDDIDTDTANVTILFGPSDEAIVLDVDLDVEGREYDAGFGYEYGSESGYHSQTDAEGDVSVSGYSIDESFYKDRDGIESLRHAAKDLHVPGRQSKNPHVVLKYFEHAFGGKKKLISVLQDYINEHYGDDLINRKIQNDKDNYDPY